MKFILAFTFISLFPKILYPAEFSREPFGMFGTKRTLVEAWYFDEGTGTVTRGTRGRSNGALTGSVAWVSGLHRNAVGFVNGTERVTFDTETLFDFMDTNSTFTVSVVYRMTNGSNTQPNGKFLAKQNSSTEGGWHLIATTDLVGDFALNVHDGTDVSKLVTGVVNVSTSGGRNHHVLTFDYTCRRNFMTSAVDAKFNLDGKNVPLSLTGTSEVLVANNVALTAGNFNAGTGGGTNFAIEMMAVWDGSGRGQLTDAEMALPYAYVFGN